MISVEVDPPPVPELFVAVALWVPVLLAVPVLLVDPVVLAILG
jgi:hypothetical protein